MKSKNLLFWHFFIAFLPFWFRLMQCFRRYYETKLIANLKNAGKYFTSMCVQGGAIFFTLYASNLDTMNHTIFYSFIGLNVFSTIYSLYWDLYMDWGFFHSSRLDHLRKRDLRSFLRERTLFPTWFYLTSILSNLVLRFVWVLPLLRGFPDWVH